MKSSRQASFVKGHFAKWWQVNQEWQKHVLPKVAFMPAKVVFGHSKSETQTHREACLVGILPRKAWEKERVSQKNQKKKVWKRKRCVKHACNNCFLPDKTWKGMHMVNYAVCLSFSWHFPVHMRSAGENPQSSGPSKIAFCQAKPERKRPLSCFQNPWET